MIHKIFIVFLIAYTVNGSFAQEILLPLQSNPAKTSLSNNPETKNEIQNTVTLPFFDDFSYPGPYPIPQLWIDKHTYINNGYAIKPVTIGTATFDAMDEHGKIYPEAASNSYQIAADMLTSQAVRLDSVFNPTAQKLLPADSIALTFYYQPQGNGNAPRERDSLVVEFLHTPGYFTDDSENPGEEIWIDDLWISVWRTTGKSMNQFLSDHDSTYFKRVVIKIEDEAYLRNDFRFRFRNYASFPLVKTPINYGGNTSIWNIDYVFLDRGISLTDSAFYDIAFAAPAQSALQKYTSMPWSHYIANPAQNNRNTGFDVTITNLGDITYNYLYRYFMMDENNNVVRNYSGGQWNIAPFSQAGYQNYQPHANPPLVANPFGTLNPATSRQFRVFHVLREGAIGDDFTRNDTLVFNQTFDNYFAYDNGIPTNGYGLVGFNPKAAIRFVLGHADTLEAVQFFFNATLNNQNRKPFLLTVWKSLNPEEIIYQSNPVTVEYGPWLNQFVSYPIDETLIVSDTIYVGWQQSSDDFLNVGFDFTADASANTFVNSAGDWQPTLYKGAIMMRPVFGAQSIVSVPEESENNLLLRIFPNPANGPYISLESALSTIGTIHIYDLTGKIVLEAPWEITLNISGLAPGIYILHALDQTTGQRQTQRLVIAR